jgi:hypothetical protein
MPADAHQKHPATNQDSSQLGEPKRGEVVARPLLRLRPCRTFLFGASNGITSLAQSRGSSGDFGGLPNLIVEQPSLKTSPMHLPWTVFGGGSSLVRQSMLRDSCSPKFAIEEYPRSQAAWRL